MKVYLNRFTALTLVCTLVVTSLSVSSFATDYQSKYNFWNWLYDNGGFVSKSIASAADSVCSLSDDGLHHSTQHQKRNPAGDGRYEDESPVYDCICDICGQTFSAVATDLANSYDDGSDGYVSIDSNGRVYGSGEWIIHFQSAYSGDYTVSVDSADSLRVNVVPRTASTKTSFGLAYRFMMPVDCIVYFDGDFKYIDSSGNSVDAFKKFSKSEAPYDTVAQSSFIDNVRAVNVSGNVGYLYQANYVSGDAGVSYITQFTIPRIYSVVNDPQSMFQRIPVNIGGSVQYTDDNSNNKIYDAEFMDFSTNEYHNPVTDYSTKVDNWEYDYSTRTYTGYTENGEVKIVYGDENITVVEGGNTYNYYYAAPSSGGGGSGSDDGSSGDDEGLFGQLGELLGTLLGGLIDLITGVLSNVMDNLIALVTMTIEKLGSIVNLFGSFGDALRSLWSWLPDDIITILSAGVSVVIFACVIKLFI